ncbi:MAG: hypothetical protein QOG05_1323 [Streptosporangiaceae bacterium]|nr:hypothetical protein [Streptosporangiaceae bacterium]
MDIVWQVLIGLTVTFIGFVIGAAWKSAKLSFAYWRNPRFWKPLSSGKVVIVADKFDKHNAPKLRGWEASGLVGGGGMLAALEVVKLLDDLGLQRVGRKFSIVYHNEDDTIGHDLKSNLFCIGSPDANTVTAKILNDIGYRIPENRGFSASLRPGRIYDRNTGVNAGEGEGEAVDYGRLIKVRNPNVKNRCVFILWGNSGYGTWGAANLLRLPQLREELKDRPSVRRGQDVEFQFQINIDGRVAQDPVVTRVTELSPKTPDLTVVGPSSGSMEPASTTWTQPARANDSLPPPSG